MNIKLKAALEVGKMLTITLVATIVAVVAFNYVETTTLVGFAMILMLAFSLRQLYLIKLSSLEAKAEQDLKKG